MNRYTWTLTKRAIKGYQMKKYRWSNKGGHKARIESEERNPWDVANEDAIPSLKSVDTREWQEFMEGIGVYVRKRLSTAKAAETYGASPWTRSQINYWTCVQKFLAQLEYLGKPTRNV